MDRNSNPQNTPDARHPNLPRANPIIGIRGAGTAVAEAIGSMQFACSLWRTHRIDNSDNLHMWTQSDAGKTRDVSKLSKALRERVERGQRQFEQSLDYATVGINRLEWDLARLDKLFTDEVREKLANLHSQAISIGNSPPGESYVEATQYAAHKWLKDFDFVAARIEKRRKRKVTSTVAIGLSVAEFREAWGGTNGIAWLYKDSVDIDIDSLRINIKKECLSATTSIPREHPMPPGYLGQGRVRTESGEVVREASPRIQKFIEGLLNNHQTANTPELEDAGVTNPSEVFGIIRSIDYLARYFHKNPKKGAGYSTSLVDLRNDK